MTIRRRKLLQSNWNFNYSRCGPISSLISLSLSLSLPPSLFLSETHFLFLRHYKAFSNNSWHSLKPPLLRNCAVNSQVHYLTFTVKIERQVIMASLKNTVQKRHFSRVICDTYTYTHTHTHTHIYIYICICIYIYVYIYVYIYIFIYIYLYLFIYLFIYLFMYNFYNLK